MGPQTMVRAESETEIENKRENRAISCTLWLGARCVDNDTSPAEAPLQTPDSAAWTELLRAGVTKAASALFYFQFNDVSPQQETRRGSVSVCLSVWLEEPSFATNFVAVANENENAAPMHNPD